MDEKQGLFSPAGQDELEAWHRFEQSGAVTDYLHYCDTASAKGVPYHADQNQRIGAETAQHRGKRQDADHPYQ